ncbi:hypothetical protein BLA29_004153, partial [Euroglyphus maynei]
MQTTVPSTVSNNIINGFNHLVHHHSITHHQQHPLHAQQSNGSIPFDAQSPYSLAHLASSNGGQAPSSSPTSAFYDTTSSLSDQQQLASNSYEPGTNENNSNTTAPLQQLDSFTSVFVASSYLTSNNHPNKSEKSDSLDSGSKCNEYDNDDQDNSIAKLTTKQSSIDDEQKQSTVDGEANRETEKQKEQ